MARDRPSPYEERSRDARLESTPTGITGPRPMRRGAGCALGKHAYRWDRPSPYEERSGGARLESATTGVIGRGMARDRPSHYEEREERKEMSIIGTTSNFCRAARRGRSLYFPGLPS